MLNISKGAMMSYWLDFKRLTLFHWIFTSGRVLRAFGSNLALLIHVGLGVTVSLISPKCWVHFTRHYLKNLRKLVSQPYTFKYKKNNHNSSKKGQRSTLLLYVIVIVYFHKCTKRWAFSQGLYWLIMWLSAYNLTQPFVNMGLAACFYTNSCDPDIQGDTPYPFVKMMASFHETSCNLSRR